MVQYIHTPWRDRAELLQVRAQFYPQHTSTTTPTGTPTEHDLDAEKQQRQAVARVCMWMHRGDCPHLIEATAFLMDAVLGDLQETRAKGHANFVSVRLAYAMAFSRFVTGLLDGQQDKLRKQGMYSIAKNVGMPATFVELRHRATHEPLPSLKHLRSGARDAIEWIWDFYWKGLTAPNKNTFEKDSSSDRRRVLVNYLRAQDDAVRSDLRAKWKSWGEKPLLLALQDIADTSDEPSLTLQALQLSSEILGSGTSPTHMSKGQPPRSTDSIDSMRAELQMLNNELEGLEGTEAMEEVQDIETSDVTMENADSETTNAINDWPPGWSQPLGTWTPKPIGEVYGITHRNLLVEQ